MSTISPSHKLSAFTIIELLVVMFILMLLIGLLMPGLQGARAQAKEIRCQSNLNTFGKGFHLYAEDNRDYLCSGSFDPEVSNGRDGPVDVVGWVADLVNAELARPGEMLCPTNAAVYNQKLRPGGAGDDSYTIEETEDLIERGYNTNYTQAWYMARTAWVPRRASNTASAYNFKRVDTTEGPLRITQILAVSPARVPLLGDGRTDNDEMLMGERCVKTMTDGPFGGPYGIQNYADFGPAHGAGSRIGGDKGHSGLRANVLFADGHVGVLQDNDRDGEFAIDDTVDPAEQRDLDPREVFDGVIGMGRRSRDPWKMK